MPQINQIKPVPSRRRRGVSVNTSQQAVFLSQRATSNNNRSDHARPRALFSRQIINLRQGEGKLL
ncbi:hypothetical protein E2C01_098167 [Portunus trituberculatus]|uniref:Uncharacterized protein n=1 Tax=Portunus trituberculatus TaxID=210409 RepID=A0A5B7K6Y3_PORTR|nr:hypothetical protein [Portunus trituberculatus]